MNLRLALIRILKAGSVEVLAFSAISLIFYGTWEIYRPSAFIFLGMVLGYIYLKLSGIRFGDKK